MGVQVQFCDVPTNQVFLQFGRDLIFIQLGRVDPLPFHKDLPCMPTFLVLEVISTIQDDASIHLLTIGLLREK
jgi:hypothetical protein